MKDWCGIDGDSCRQSTPGNHVSDVTFLQNPHPMNETYNGGILLNDLIDFMNAGKVNE